MVAVNAFSVGGCVSGYVVSMASIFSGKLDRILQRLAGNHCGLDAEEMDLAS